MNRMLAALLVAVPAMVALLAPLAARAGGAPAPRDPPPPAREPPASSERVELTCRFEPWSTAGRCALRAGEGGLSDEGAAEDDGAFAGCDGAVVRRIEGARGTLRLRLSGVMRTGAFPPVIGRWEVVDGTGAYARLRGGGTYSSVSSGAVRSTAWDRQYLVGHVDGL